MYSWGTQCMFCARVLGVTLLDFHEDLLETKKQIFTDYFAGLYSEMYVSFELWSVSLFFVR